jgi:hypothetical protein
MNLANNRGKEPQSIAAALTYHFLLHFMFPSGVIILVFLRLTYMNLLKDPSISNDDIKQEMCPLVLLNLLVWTE